MSAIMCKGGCACFRKTATGQERITDASHLTISASSSWATYPDTPIAGYPYQVIFSAASYTRLIVNSAQWYYNFSGDTQLKSAAVGKMYQLIGGVWEYLSDADNYSYTALLQANADVYDNATLNSVYFARTTAGGMGSERVKGAFYKKINSGVDRRQQWTNYPDSPIETENFPYQFIFGDYLFACDNPVTWYGYLRHYAQVGSHYMQYLLTNNEWVLYDDRIVDSYGYVGGEFAGFDHEENNYDIYYTGGGLYITKTTTIQQDAGIWTESRRINL